MLMDVLDTNPELEPCIHHNIPHSYPALKTSTHYGQNKYCINNKETPLCNHFQSHTRLLLVSRARVSNVVRCYASPYVPNVFMNIQ